MAKKKSYLPKALSKLNLWLKTFSTRFGEYAAILGFTTTQTTDQEGEIEEVLEAIKYADAKLQESKAAVAKRDEKIKKLLKTLKPRIKGIKSNPAYTSGIGKGLQIIGPDDDFNPSTFKTVLTFSVYMDYVEINFVKSGTKGVNIYSRLAGENEFTFLKFKTESPFHDDRKNNTPGIPEIREYRAYGVLKDEQLKNASDIIAVAFIGKGKDEKEVGIEK